MRLIVQRAVLTLLMAERGREEARRRGCRGGRCRAYSEAASDRERPSSSLCSFMLLRLARRHSNSESAE